ncbi:hypothetical protein [Ignatzschineria cameli]|uniref:hypothetical protein n=1 Tax=Ignatzschineria cameli TaxID=2182793 RepID=UPI0010579239|nr:hypothetical protein [Ignatzschineria cameli]
MHCRILLSHASTDHTPAIIVTFTINHIETKKIDALPDLTIAFFYRSHAGSWRFPITSKIIDSL